jgi:hypothetical protein
MVLQLNASNQFREQSICILLQLMQVAWSLRVCIALIFKSLVAHPRSERPPSRLQVCGTGFRCACWQTRRWLLLDLFGAYKACLTVPARYQAGMAANKEEGPFPQSKHL